MADILPDLHFQEVRTIQARHLAALAQHLVGKGHSGVFAARIDGGKWREVLDIYDHNYDPADPGQNLPTRHDKTNARIAAAVRYAYPCWVAVRYLVEEDSTTRTVGDAIAEFRTCDLIEVQIPVPGGASIVSTTL